MCLDLLLLCDEGSNEAAAGDSALWRMLAASSREARLLREVWSVSYKASWISWRTSRDMVASARQLAVRFAWVTGCSAWGARAAGIAVRQAHRSH